MTRPLPAEPLFTPKAAALQLGLSVKTIMAHVAAGRLRFSNIGTMQRKVHRFTSYNLTTFLEKQKIKEQPCPSSSALVLKPTVSTFNSGAVDFMAIPKPGTKKTPKPSNAI
jgi:hypothetical protein